MGTPSDFSVGKNQTQYTGGDDLGHPAGEGHRLGLSVGNRRQVCGLGRKPGERSVCPQVPRVIWTMTRNLPGPP